MVEQSSYLITFQFHTLVRVGCEDTYYTFKCVNIHLPSASNMRGMSRYFSAISKAVFKFSIGLSYTWKTNIYQSSLEIRQIYH